jgi:predicted MPP superfamily phosphohydrolase
MFHTLITLAYILPNIYVFLRIMQLFINKGYRYLYAIIYLFFVLIYPISNFFGDGNRTVVIEILRLISNYLLPFYLYLFLFVLLFDILLLLNILFKAIPPGIIKRTHFKIISLSSILVSVTVVVIAGIVNFNNIRISEYSISVPARSSKTDNLKVAFVSDFHLQNRTNTGFVEKFIKRINEIRPDLMLFGGDIVEGDRDDGNLAKFENFFSGIKTKYGVYGVLGNHEHYAGEDKGNFFNKAGIKILADTVITIDSSFSLGGRNDSHLKGRKGIDQLMKHYGTELPFILIDHRPTDIDNVSREPVDIQFSGHTHNGQLFPINLITRNIYRLSWGHEKIGNTDFFVSSGIRLWGPPVRTTGKSEIMVINIKFIR